MITMKAAARIATYRVLPGLLALAVSGCAQPYQAAGNVTQVKAERVQAVSNVLGDRLQLMLQQVHPGLGG